MFWLEGHIRLFLGVLAYINLLYLIGKSRVRVSSSIKIMVALSYKRTPALLAQWRS